MRLLQGIAVIGIKIAVPKHGTVTVFGQCSALLVCPHVCQGDFIILLCHCFQVALEIFEVW